MAAYKRDSNKSRLQNQMLSKGTGEARKVKESWSNADFPGPVSVSVELQDPSVNIINRSSSPEMHLQSNGVRWGREGKKVAKQTYLFELQRLHSHRRTIDNPQEEEEELEVEDRCHLGNPRSGGSVEEYGRKGSRTPRLEIRRMKVTTIEALDAVTIPANPVVLILNPGIQCKSVVTTVTGRVWGNPIYINFAICEANMDFIADWIIYEFRS
ncbi:hypothetical protein HAX54_002120 [Datura stramonium]|uniref:Uncharacterized protein n=1 Tax=Datura stramonium TaxID=4076 RepID=A0ABS8T495_DATST|nr:hypothetical protein [Datura stramonium]